MTSYWFSDLCSLTNSFNINPFSSGDRNYRYNSLTRLIIILTIIGLFIPNQDKIMIILAGIVSIFITNAIYMFTHSKTYKAINTPVTPITTELNTANTTNGAAPTTVAAVNNAQKASEDLVINQANQNTPNYIPQNTELKKNIYFLEANQMPTNVNSVSPALNSVNPTDKTVPGAIVKTSIQEKNI